MEGWNETSLELKIVKEETPVVKIGEFEQSGYKKDKRLLERGGQVVDRIWNLVIIEKEIEDAQNQECSINQKEAQEVA